ncbi:TetR/AcrR family transcriptional regulator [uncultured Amnibacterium sp.]|uniref:TetR/AcrR family transcriptional regulator n=1 Tax=uncultured Amnibacterium sp. TaxID=1631851 RepID=UPI0035C9E8BF
MERTPTRLARGERRAALILEAAVAVFARVGVERATTNAIAAEAGISPGSLYQFFRDKQDIAVALGRRYAAELRAAYETAFEAFDPVAAPLEEVLDRTLDPIVAVKEGNAAFAPMFARPDLPVALTEPVA